MIKASLYGLTQIISKHMSRANSVKHTCYLTHKSIEDASTERGKGERHVSWIRPSTMSTIADSTNRKHRRLYMMGKYNTGQFERVQYIPVRIETDWRIALPSSMESYYSMMGKVLSAIALSEFCFALKMKLGDQSTQIDVVVESSGDFGSIPFPDLESDVDADRPTIEIPLVLSNIPLIVGEYQEVPAIKQVVIEHVASGHQYNLDSS